MGIRVTQSFALTCALAFAVIGGEAKAGGDADAAKTIIHQHCVDCHEVPGYRSEQQTPAIEAPSFPEIAANPDAYTRERLRSFLQKPHWPMSQFWLSDRDIDNLLAFIESLKVN